MVALRLLAVDDISYQSWECSHLEAYGDIWVVFTEQNLLSEFLQHFYHASGQDLVSMPYSENFF